MAKENAILPSIFICGNNILTAALLHKLRLGFTLPSKYVDSHLIKLATPKLLFLLIVGIFSVFSIALALYHYVDWMLLNVLFASMLIALVAYIILKNEMEH
ncbi:hypothetical protein [Paenibacillus puerhi]|uniref:hypothetical protein n=1 Tax=Paenibacillus puerhi TaxID=2692622 RepID=UPI00135C959F|nr:hypothetical protein [Paenibacillus puerhi]